MRKLILLSITIICMTFLASCEKEITSLEGTTWTARHEYDGGWSEDKLVFNLTHATYTYAADNGYTWEFTCRYTYNPPVISIYDGLEGASPSTGTVKNRRLSIWIHQTDDIMKRLDLKKQ